MPTSLSDEDVAVPFLLGLAGPGLAAGSGLPVGALVGLPDEAGEGGHEAVLPALGVGLAGGPVGVGADPGAVGGPDPGAQGRQLVAAQPELGAGGVA